MKKMPLVVLKYSPALLKDEQDQIVKSLNQLFADGVTKYTDASLSPIKFSQLSVYVYDVGGINLLGKRELPVGAYAIQDFEIGIELTENISKEDERKLKIEERMSTLVKDVKLYKTSLRLLYETTISEIEKVVGTGEVFLTREGMRSIKAFTKVRRELTNMGGRPEDFDRLLTLWQATLEKPVEDKFLFEVDRRSVIWTPEIGRVEIQPTKKDFLTQKEQLFDAMKLREKADAEKIQEAKDSKDFESWYRLNHEIGREAKQGSGQFKIRFDMISTLALGTDGTAALSIEKDDARRTNKRNNQSMTRLSVGGLSMGKASSPSSMCQENSLMNSRTRRSKLTISN